MLALSGDQWVGWWFALIGTACIAAGIWAWIDSDQQSRS